MTNELIFLTIILFDFAFIQVIYRYDKSFLFVVIILNILLISVFGSKLIALFGFTSNTGNVFYAAVFFATQLLVERDGKKEAYKSIWIGIASIIVFMMMAQLIIFAIGLPQTQQVNNAIDILFKAAPRVAAASLIAYVLSQLVNVWVFSYLRQKTQGRRLYLRVNSANIVGQLVDSVIFFTIAFYGTISLATFFQVMIVGYLLKVAIGVLSTPFFYFNKTPSR